MKIIKTASSRKIILSKSEWESIGHNAGWQKIYHFANKDNKLKDVIFKGTLKQKPNGFTYLDVNDGIINGLFSLIESEEAIKPPKQGIGAHVSVFKEEEIEGKDIKEIGKEFKFKLGEMKMVNPDGWDEMKKVYFVQIKSTELEDLRSKYDLSKKIKGHEFHITIAVEKSKS